MKVVDKILTPILRPSLNEMYQTFERDGIMTAAVKAAFDRAYQVISEYDGQVIYIAGALTDQPEEVKARYTDLSDILISYGIFGYAPARYGTDPVKNPNVSPDEVHAVDYIWAACVARMHFNFLVPTAIGPGIEFGQAHPWAPNQYADKPTVLLLPEEYHLSRLPGGMPNLLQIIRYTSNANMRRQAESLIREMGEYMFLPRTEHWLGTRTLEDYVMHKRGLAETAKFKDPHNWGILDLDTRQMGVFTGWRDRDYGSIEAVFPDGGSRWFDSQNPRDGKPTLAANYRWIPLGMLGEIAMTAMRGNEARYLHAEAV